MKKRIQWIGLILLSLIMSGCQPIEEEKYYDVIFYDAQDQIYATQHVLEGEDALPPTPPTKEGYVFVEWDTDFTNINQDLSVRPIFEIEEEGTYYRVLFYVDRDVISVQQVLEHTSALEPSEPVKEGYTFIGWSSTFDVITSDLEVYALFEKDTLVPERIQYASYVSDWVYTPQEPMQNVLDQLNYETSLVLVMHAIVYGGFREADRIHYYDADNYRSRNVYGFEIALDQHGVVIDKNVLVDLPQGGFILSGHSSTATLLQDQILIGDVVRYDRSLAIAECFRDPAISNVIGLQIQIEQVIDQVESANEDYLALDYALIYEKINEAIAIYNTLTTTYNASFDTAAKRLLIDVAFLMVEGRAVQTRAFWHYPLRSSIYPETSLESVQALLDQVVTLGFNTIYINTNFNGSSIYQSDYLIQRLTTLYSYGTYKDYLECFVEEAHLRGLKVIAWTNTLIGGDGSITNYYTSRNWIQIGYQGENNTNGMYFLDISNPDVQTFLGNVFYELADEYNLDGIEFDFIRYPSGNLYSYTGVISDTSGIKDHGFTDSFINAFMEYKSLTGDLRVLLAQSETLRVEWLNFKRALLNDTVEMLVTTIHSTKPDMLITAAVMPNATSANNVYLQNWAHWINEGWIDILDPMVYTGDTESVISQLTAMKNTVNGRAQIVAGIYPDSGGISSSVVAQQFSRVQETFDMGWCKFSGRSFLTSVPAMNSYQGMARHYTVTPHDTYEQIVLAYIVDSLDKIEHYYQYQDTTSDYTSLLNRLQTIYLEWDSQAMEIDTILNELTLDINAISNATIRDKLIRTILYISELQPTE